MIPIRQFIKVFKKSTTDKTALVRSLEKMDEAALFDWLGGYTLARRGLKTLFNDEDFASQISPALLHRLCEVVKKNAGMEAMLDFLMVVKNKNTVIKILHTFDGSESDDTPIRKEFLGAAIKAGNVSFTRVILEKAKQNNTIDALLNVEKFKGITLTPIGTATSIEGYPDIAPFITDNNIAMVELLLEYVSPNINSEGISLMMLSEGNAAMQALLLRFGADKEGATKVQKALRYTHTLGLAGNVPIYFEGIKDELPQCEKYALEAEGNIPEKALNHFSTLIDGLPDAFPRKPELVAAVAEFARQIKNIDRNALLTQIENKIPVYLNLGFPGHAVTMLIIDNQIIFTNRGDGALMPCGPRIYTLNNMDNMKTFLEKCFTDPRPSKEVLLSEFNLLVQNEELVGYIPQKPQEKENCSHANPKSSLAVPIALKEGKYLAALKKLRGDGPLTEEWLTANEPAIKALWKQSKEREIYKDEVSTDTRKKVIDLCKQQIQTKPKNAGTEKSILRHYVMQNKDSVNPKKINFISHIISSSVSLGFSKEEASMLKGLAIKIIDVWIEKMEQERAASVPELILPGDRVKALQEYQNLAGMTSIQDILITMSLANPHKLEYLQIIAKDRGFNLFTMGGTGNRPLLYRAVETKDKSLIETLFKAARAHSVFVMAVNAQVEEDYTLLTKAIALDEIAVIKSIVDNIYTIEDFWKIIEDSAALYFANVHDNKTLDILVEKAIAMGCIATLFDKYTHNSDIRSKILVIMAEKYPGINPEAKDVLKSFLTHYRDDDTIEKSEEESKAIAFFMDERDIENADPLAVKTKPTLFSSAGPHIVDVENVVEKKPHKKLQ